MHFKNFKNYCNKIENVLKNHFFGILGKKHADVKGPKSMGLNLQ